MSVVFKQGSSTTCAYAACNKDAAGEYSPQQAQASQAFLNDIAVERGMTQGRGAVRGG